MTLVVIKCQTCKRVLTRVESAPDDERRWAGWVCLDVCPRHGQGAGHGNIAKWQESQRRAGKTADRVETGKWVPWSALRSAVDQARTPPRRARVVLLSGTGDVLEC